MPEVKTRSLYKSKSVGQDSSRRFLLPKLLKAWNSNTSWRAAVCVFSLSAVVQACLFWMVLGPAIGDVSVVSAALVIVALSGFVAAVATSALDHWVLNPLIFLRDELLRTVHDPEDPVTKTPDFNMSSEIGQATVIAHKLIMQNARNLKRIRSEAEGKIRKLAYYDSLTGLPNRTFFLKSLEDRSRSSFELQEDEDQVKMAVITMDLDHFKDINDSMGHDVGDAILRAIGRRLKMVLPPSAIIARTGEDEFAIMLPLMNSSTSARDVATRVAGSIRSSPFTVIGEDFQVRASIGVTTFPDDGVSPEQVLKNADIALNRSKEVGRDTITEYSHDFDHAIQKRFQILRDLREALENQDLRLHYQPQLSLKTGEITGVEALIRWWKKDNSPEGGKFIPPFEFIPVAENSGLIIPIGEWVLRRACEAGVEWKKVHGKDIRIGVNVSPAQFMQNDLQKTVSRVLRDTGLDPKYLELEVTESLFMEDVEHTIHVLGALHEMGVELAIDDFGTGYSSLSYLRQFPIDRLKIDRSFIKNALTDQDDAAIARTIVGLGHSLGLKVIAEGVENIEQQQFLMDQGCDDVQGFYYCKPIPEGNLMEFINKYSGKLESFS